MHDYFLDYIIRKSFFKCVFGLHNPEVILWGWHKKDKNVFSCWQKIWRWIEERVYETCFQFFHTWQRRFCFFFLLKLRFPIFLDWNRDFIEFYFKKINWNCVYYARLELENKFSLKKVKIIFFIHDFNILEKN